MDDFNPSQLKLHLDVLAINFPDEIRATVNIFDVKEYVLGLSPLERGLISEIETVVKLILSCPQLMQLRLVL